MPLNPITLIDGYKADHRRHYAQAPPGSILTGRHAPHASPAQEGDPFRDQFFRQRYLMEEFGEGFFRAPVDDVCAKYERRMNGYLGPNTIGTEHIRAAPRPGVLAA